MKKKAVLIFAASAFFLFIIVFTVYFSIPRTILKYKSEDGKTKVTITQKKVLFEPVPSRVFDYSLNVGKAGKLFDKKLFHEDFSFNAIGSIGIRDDNVEVIFTSDTVTVVINDKVRPVPLRFTIRLKD